MATDKQIEANRANAMKAGVRSEEGKAIVRYNAFKHGLTAKTLLSGLKSIKETEVIYREICEGLEGSFQPRNYFEYSLVDQMARALLKMRRADHLERGCFKDELGGWDEGPKLTLDGVRLVLREVTDYRAAIEAQYFKAYAALLRHRQATQLDLFSELGESS